MRWEFGAVGELDQGDVVGHARIVGDVPSGSIGEHGHVLVIGDRAGEPRNSYIVAVSAYGMARAKAFSELP